MGVKNPYTGELKIGILGGGQLGRMLIQSAVDFNFSIDILDSDKNAPCKNIAHSFTNGDLQNYETVLAFGEKLDLVTIEIEKVNTEALKKLEQKGVQVYPQPAVIELIQNKRLQKQFYKENDIPTADFILTDTKEAVLAQEAYLPAVNKLAKDGYDGKGVQMMRQKEDLAKAFEAPSLLEKLVDFEKEIAVIVARNKKGEITAFPTVEMVFHPTANLVEYLFSPAELEENLRDKAKSLAKKVIEKLDMVGILAVEMFVTKSGEILVNEVAPRPHNSGHQTIEGNVTSQYEQHLRAILNLPLGDTAVKVPTAMVNLLGEDGFKGKAVYEGMDEILSTPGVHVHLYGKTDTKPFRKMGHVTIEDADIKSLKKKADYVKNTLKIKA